MKYPGRELVGLLHHLKEAEGETKRPFDLDREIRKYEEAAI